MTKFILTGHGQFASGLASSVQLISGMKDSLEIIDFEEGMSADELNEAIKSAVSSRESAELTIIFTDIPGGTPFNQSVLLSSKLKEIEIVTGTHLPVLLEALFNQSDEKEDLLHKIKEAGAQGFSIYGLKQKQNNKPDEQDMDGI